jgi:hypothetical protein
MTDYKWPKDNLQNIALRHIGEEYQKACNALPRSELCMCGHVRNGTGSPLVGHGGDGPCYSCDECMLFIPANQNPPGSNEEAMRMQS